MNKAQSTTELNKTTVTGAHTAARPVFIFHWLGWRCFLRDLLIMQVGFFLTALSITIFVNAGLGPMIPWGLYEYLFADLLSVPTFVGFFLVTLGAFLLALLLREPFGWGTPVSFVLVGFLWVSVLEEVVPTLPAGAALEVLYVVLAVLAGAFGTAIFLSVNAGPPPRDILWLAIARRLHINPGIAYVILDVAMILVGLLLGLSIGLVTIVHAITVGPAVWLAFRLLRIEPQAEFWSKSSRAQTGIANPH